MDATAGWYARFAELEAAGQSAIYEEWARGVAADDAILDLLRTLPRPKQQPNLIFAVSRLLGAPEGAFGEFRSWLLNNWDDVDREARVRSTQTNEPRRCAALLPLLAEIEGPIALLEVGASAGLCLYPDRYSYRYDDGEVLGESTVLIECETRGIAVPTALPEIVWRGGIDLNPLDVDNADDMLWLETLVWPEQHERRARIRAAIEIARADPPTLVRGDAVEELAGLVGQVLDASTGSATVPTLVIFHSGVLVYMSRESRAGFVDAVTALPATWISNEAQGAVPGIQPEGTAASSLFALAVDGQLRALTGPHGQSIHSVP
jgi:hypothetical protein